MDYSTLRMALLASTVAELESRIQRLVQSRMEDLLNEVTQFFSRPLSPFSTQEFECGLRAALQELGRVIMEWTLNELDPEDGDTLPKVVRFEAGEYRRESTKTRNGSVATTFGEIVLWRYPYRFRQRESEPKIFPLELMLGLNHGATPALADLVSRVMAETGASQNQVLERLRSEHRVRWGAQRLCNVVKEEADAAKEMRHQFQVAQLLELLNTARESRGKNKPILAVGRDGISVSLQPRAIWQVASVATVSVYDRQGKRLGTVYLAQMPESKQVTLTGQLSDLIRDVMQQWEGPFPRLCYITDCGENETQFYRRVLCQMRDPRRPQKRLPWVRIVDYYHACERITTIGEALFRKGTVAATSWSKRMRKSLLQPNGPSRVLHSAATHYSKLKKKLGKTRKDDYRRATSYLRTRTRFMDYAQYRKQQLPIGSGITEAACKSVFAQRMKLSGMRWKKPGGQAILDLRTILMSGIWNQVRNAVLDAKQPTVKLPYGHREKTTSTNAA